MPTPANSINEQTTGISGFTSTSYVGSPTTQHCVQVGGSTSSTLSSVTNGTTGQVLTAITNSDPVFQSPIFYQSSVTLSSNDIKNLKATPITLVPAKGAGTVIVPIAIFNKFNYGGNSAFTNGQTITTKYDNGSGTVSWTSIMSGTFIQLTASSYGGALYSNLNIFNAGTDLSNLENLPIVINNTGASEITGNADNDNTIVVTLTYYILNV